MIFPVWDDIELKLSPTEIGIVSAQPEPFNRLLVAILVGASFICLVRGLFQSKTPKGLLHLIQGKDGRYSNSQFQTVTWFFMFFVAFVTTQIFRITHGNLTLAAFITVPGNLLALSGLSLLTYVGSAIITDSQVRNQQVIKVTTTTPSFPHDLFHNDAGEFDLGDFQSALVSVMAAVGYFALFLGYLGSLSLKQDTLPDVDGTLLTIFGLSQGAYLTKKALRVSEQEGLALSVSPVSITCAATAPGAPPAPCTVVLTVQWTKGLIGNQLSLTSFKNNVPHTAVFTPGLVLTLDSTLRTEITVTLQNPGAGTPEDVVIRAVVNGLLREAKVTVTGA